MQPIHAGGRVALGLSVALAVVAPNATAQSGPTLEDVTPAEVKRFLDPTVMVNTIEYTFQFSSLPGDLSLFQHKLYGGWSINHWTALWAEIPVLDYSQKGRALDPGVGDLLLGGGFVVHEDLDSRYTGAAVWFEVLAPTGDAAEATGFDSWVLAPGAGVAFNPTDTFPIYVAGSYLHSVGELQLGEDGELVNERVRSLQIDVQTVHIFPKGFFVSALPSFTINFEQDFNLFSLGVGVGRALNRNVALSGGYVHHVAGRETFNQAAVFGMSVVWGEKTAAK